MVYRKVNVMDKKNDKFFSDIECQNQSSLRELQEKLLQEQLQYLSKNSVFYQNKFAQAGLKFEDIKSIADLEKVPFTIKQDIRDSLAQSPPLGLHLAAPMDDVVQVQASSGTTGSPAYVALTENDIEVWQDGSARGLFAAGIRPGDKVLHAFSMSKGFTGGVPIFQALQYSGAIDIPVGADGGIDRLLTVCKDIRPRVIIGTPNFILHMAEVCKDITGIDARDMGVELIAVGGEPGGGIPAIRQAIKTAWNAECREMLGGTDLGVIYWSECDTQVGMHMVAPDYVLTELINPETDEVIPWEEGATGELVYTALQREASPVFRFRSGDHVEVKGTSCSCGRTGPIVRCVGRTDDMLIVRGINVFPSAIQDVVSSMPETNGIMRVWADFEGHSTQSNLKVIVERAKNADSVNDSALSDLIMNRLRNALSFKPAVIIAPTDYFEKPGVQKIKLTLREPPGFLKV